MRILARTAGRLAGRGRPGGAVVRSARTWLAWTALLAAAGCGGDDPVRPAAPAVPEAGVRYAPADPAVVLVRDAWLDFRVSAVDGRALTVRWQRPGEPEAGGERFRYFGRDLGAEALTARVTDPGGRTWTRTWNVAVVPAGRPRVAFRPAPGTVTAYATIETAFAASTPWPATSAWHLDEAAAGGDTMLAFTPGETGRHAVGVTVQIGDSTFSAAWDVEVRPFAEARPPAVSGLTAAPGNAPGHAVLAWDGPAGSVLPLTAFEVRYGRVGPPTEASWATDPDPGGLPWTAQTSRFSRVYTTAGTGLEPGQEVWFAVRARNDRGQLSPLGPAAALRLPGQWWLEGTLTGPDGTPLAGIPVRDTRRLHATVSGADGAYRLGPYFDQDSVVVEAGTGPDAPADAAWHVARSESLAADGSRRRDFLLIPRLGSAPGCFVFDSHFMWYLRTMTKTRVVYPRRPDLRLYRWAEYPLPVHVPAWTSPEGVDYGACVRDAIALWNEALGETFLLLVDDPGAARVRWRYDLDGINYGVVELDQPGDGEYVMGELVPELVSVRLTALVPNAETCTELAIHELGHVLGLLDHAFCNTVPYAMYVTATGILDRGREQAIHPDELRAVRLIRALPNGWDMGVYPLDVP
ncbi:MAG: hypothetical protein R6X35_04135 [Candidatus Krumholzibacteriia bacterium]